jgi:murein DD-endopeptidase MepM/ murein hydrolase activator NlpD
MKRGWRFCLMPITIIIVPHKKVKSFKSVFPLWGLILSLMFFLTIVIWAINIPYSKFIKTKKELSFWQEKYRKGIDSFEDTLVQLKQTEQKLNCLLKLGSKEEVIKQVDLKNLPPSSGPVESLSALKLYLQKQKSLYFATPQGWPTPGYISSGFGRRIHPITGIRHFHHGVDIVAPKGTSVKSPANGMVIYTGRTKLNGYTIIIEHGYGYSTLYAHLKNYIVKDGQQVKRGDIIGYVGSTGLSTGDHLHYEVWKNKKRINPLPYIQGEIKFAKE